MCKLLRGTLHCKYRFRRMAKEMKNIINRGKVIKIVKNLGKQDLVVALISGGGSALLPAPPPSLTLRDKQEII